MTISIYFLIRPSRILKNGVCSIECCITVRGKRFTKQLPRQVKPSNWNQSRQEVRGKTAEAIEVNSFIEAYRQNIYTIQTKIIQSDLPHNIDTFKKALSGELDKENKKVYLLEMYSKHNAEYKILREKKRIASATHQKHTTTAKHLKGYLKEKYNLKDIGLVDINKSFIDGFEIYLRTNLNIQNNTTVNYLKNLRKILQIAFNDNIIPHNPFLSVKLHIEKTTIEYLTATEVRRIYRKDFDNDRLNNIKDCFIFCCMTGLAFIDAKSFTRKNIKVDEKGKEWITINRSKTKILSQIPLLPIAKEILEKYDYKLPMTSNQKYNAYLKEIGNICNIKKKLHSHIARHSFATISLNNGVSLKAVSSMLGHTNIKQTEHYSKLMDTTIYSEMSNMKNVLEG